MQTVEIVKALRLCAIDDCEKCNGVRYDDKMRCCTEALGLSAADRLEELLNRCARYAEAIAMLRERQRWIPVTERLPENGQRVLAYCKDHVIHDAKWSWPQNEWFDGVTGNSYFESFVTHWMSLPPAPEVE